MVVGKYNKKFITLDEVFASDIVGDGTDGITGPFETAQGGFFQGQVIPLCAGWFGEINEDFEKTIKVLGRKTPAGEDGMTIAPGEHR